MQQDKLLMLFSLIYFLNFEYRYILKSYICEYIRNCKVIFYEYTRNKYIVNFLFPALNNNSKIFEDNKMHIKRCEKYLYNYGTIIIIL